VTDAALPDYIVQALDKIDIGEGDSIPALPGFRKTVSATWKIMELALEAWGTFPQRFQYRKRPISPGAKQTTPSGQPNLFFFYVVDELAATIRYIQLTSTYRLQAIVEDIKVALAVC
jgi:hypothetical protein